MVLWCYGVIVLEHAGLPGGRQELGGALGAKVVVEQDEIERPLREEGERLANAGAVIDAETGFGREDARDALAEERVVVHQKHVQGCDVGLGHASCVFSTGQSSTAKQHPDGCGS